MGILSPMNPLEGVLRRCGATMAVRGGRPIALHFGSPATETAVCRSHVGLADRGQRVTYELRGAPDDVERALASLPEGDWFERLGPERAIVRCEPMESAASHDAMADAGGTVLELEGKYAAVGLIGPRSKDVLLAAQVDTPAIVVQEGENAFEILVAAARGEALWERLLRAGEPFEIACVGAEALEHLAVSEHLPRR